jgi:hypothetical protein
MRRFLLLLVLMIPLVGRAQNFVEKVQPGTTREGLLITKARGLGSELRATARDFATFRDPKWQALTLAQIAAATADGATSLHNLHRCSYCQEIGSSRFVIGRHPDAHKYMLAGLVEIGVEAVAAHYLRHHGPARKWYWRYAWALPQSFSLAEHTRASFHNANGE